MHGDPQSTAEVAATVPGATLRKERSKRSSRTMNLSSTDDNWNRVTQGGMDKIEVASPGRKTPPALIRKLLPTSWHGEKSSWHGSSMHSEKSGRTSVPGPPLTSPPPAFGRSFSSHGPRKTGVKTLPKPLRLPTLLNPPSSPGLLRRLSKAGSRGNIIAEVTIPSLYRHARKCQWEYCKEILIKSKRDIGYVYKKDGTTALHMAVMSRTGYINSFKSGSREFEMAPLELVEELLKRNPDVAKVRCTLNGYTPLIYACLVCDEHYSVENAASMVQLFLRYCPESINIFSKEGLSPVDVHVVSYSHHHKEKEEDSSLGKTSTAVLRTLLTHSPELALQRLSGDKVQGPLEFLYKCNQNAFSKAVMDEVYNSDEEGTILSNYTIPEKRQQVVDTVKKWWIWSWAVIVLKHGSLKQKRRGTRFAAVHAASMQIGCPTPLLSITLYAFPRQIKRSVEDKDGNQNLPLHAICSWPSHLRENDSNETMMSARKSAALTRVIEEYPLAVKAANGRGETALEISLKSGTTWDGGVRRLVKFYPKALKIQSKTTGLYPFMTAAASSTSSFPSSPSQRKDLQAVRSIYGLLRSNPKVLVQAWQKAQSSK